MTERQSHESVHDEELDCLIMWPEGTVGFMEEQKVVRFLNYLCKQHGYGRIPQLAAQIEALWRDPSKVEEFKKVQKAHRDLMNEARKTIEALAEAGETEE